MTDRNTATMEFISRGSHDKSRRVFQFESINMLKENADGNVNTYVRFGEDFLLIRIKDGEGNETQIKRHLDGRIAQVSKNGDSIDLNWSESLHPRLLSLIDSKGRKVEFIYNEKELVAVENSGGRLLKYKYKRKNPNATKVARVVVFESRCAGCLSEDEPDDQN